MRTSLLFIQLLLLILPCQALSEVTDKGAGINVSISFPERNEIRTLKGHGKHIFSVAISPDGKTLATGSLDKTIKLWNAETGETLRTLKGHRHGVWTVAFSPDGRFLASGGRDKTIIIWNPETGQIIKKLQKHRHTVISIAFSPDGLIMASGSADQKIILWNTATWEIIKVLKGHRHHVYSVAFSPDGTTLASGSRDKTIILWNVSSGKRIKSLKGHSHIVQSVAFKPDGQTLASGSRDRTIILWDVKTGKKIETLKGHKSTVHSIAFSPNSELLVSGSADKTIIIWDVKTGKQMKTLTGHTHGIMSVALSRDGTTLASGSADRNLVLRDITGFYTGQVPVYAKVPEVKMQETVPEEPAPSRLPVVAAPELSYEITIEDSNGNGVLEGGEMVKITVNIKNKGAGTAQAVEILLSGNKTLISCLGNKRLVGDIESNKIRKVTLECIMPTRLKPETAQLSLELNEQRGYSPTEIKSFAVALKPSEITETRQIISQHVDVDILPLKNKNYKKDNSYAVVIGISDYRDKVIPKVKYAKSDAEMVAKYLENIGGVPRKNIKLLTNEMVTKGDLEAYLEDWLPRRIKKDSDVFIYYAGHGSPDPQSGDAYIVPYDGTPDFKSKLYPLKRMYASLNKLPSEQVVVMLDSCFSGAGERGIISQGARPISISVENPILAGGNIFVLAAASGTQISSDFDKVRHGLFTYYLLKGMKGDADINKNGTVELQELYDFVREHVSETASIELNRDQTPVLLPDIQQNKIRKIEITKTK